MPPLLSDTDVQHWADAHGIGLDQSLGHPLAPFLQACRQAAQLYGIAAETWQAYQRILLEDGLSLPHEVHYAPATYTLTPLQATTLAYWVHALCTTTTPVQYLVGQAWFDDARYGVSPAVLIPRPETEDVVAHAWQHLQRTQPSHPVVIDFCTGSGAILLALARRWEKEHATAPATTLSGTFVGVDCCPDALAVARGNALAMAHHTPALSFAQADVTQPESPAMAALRQQLGPANVITMNPPYIPHTTWQQLDHNVREHEPLIALVAPEDGLQFYRIWAEHASHWLAPDGAMVMELGVWDAAHVQQHGLFHERVTALWVQAGFSVHCHNDLAGLPRVVVATL